MGAALRHSKMKLVAMSDTHGKHREMLHEVPEGDVLIHAGDFSKYGLLSEVEDFVDWFASHPHPHKIVIAGNHDLTLGTSSRPQGEFSPTKTKEMFEEAGLIYLEDSGVEIEGVKFYGSPYTPAYYNWAFMLPRDGRELTEKWDQIPEDTDVLITHGPPLGILDATMDYSKAGDGLLTVRIDALDLKAHIFGHVHEGHGSTGIHYNVAICTIGYDPWNPVTEIEID